MHYSIHRALAAATALIIFTTPIFAAEKADLAPDPKVLTAASSASLKGVSDAIDAKNWAQAETLDKAFLATCNPGAIDYAYANLLMANICSTQKRFAEAVPYLETALAQKLFEPADVQRYTTALVHLYVETNQKPKAVALIEQYKIEVPHLPADMVYMYAVLLMETGKGQAALEQAELLMRYDLHPPKENYQLAASCAQNVNNYEKACAYLDRLIEMEPRNEMYWNQLVAMHYNAGELLAAVVSLERAQENGLLNKEINYITRIELYYNLERFPEAAKAIEECLANKTIPNELKYWDMLANCYDMTGEPEKADKVLEQASASTKWGAIDVRLAERSYRAGNYEKAIAHFESAIKKADVDNQGDIWVLMASASIETRNVAKAENALTHAAAYPDETSKVEKLQKSLNQLKKQIEDEKKQSADAKK
jgi:tetratricopeptide (TPR) repeat protein